MPLGGYRGGTWKRISLPDIIDTNALEVSSRAVQIDIYLHALYLFASFSVCVYLLRLSGRCSGATLVSCTRRSTVFATCYVTSGNTSSTWADLCFRRTATANWWRYCDCTMEPTTSKAASYGERDCSADSYAWFPAFRIRCRSVAVAVSVKTVSVQVVYAVAAGACARQVQDAGRGKRAPSFPRKRVGGAPGAYERQIRKKELDPIWTE